MRLRWRVTIAIGGTTIAILAAISWATYSFFASAEVRELDRELIARVQHEADYLEHSEGVVNAGTLRVGALDNHVKYAALYDKQGGLTARSPNFDMPVPERALLPGAGGKPFDLGELRAVLWPIDEGELLLAASRVGLDADLRELRRLLLELFVLGIVLSVVAASWIARRLTRSVEHLAQVAQKIGTGDAGARVSMAALDGSPEVHGLGVELNHMIDSLQSALSAQRRFVSNAAHELRSPLTALRGELELALRRERSVDDYRAALGEALGSVADLNKLADDLLDLAKGTPDGAEVSDVAAVLDAAVRMTDVRDASARGVRIQLDVAPQQARGRHADLARLFRNLIENALAHAPNDSTVRVRAQGLEVSVEDDGAGVTDELAARMFEPFVRGGQERTRSGAGLGLAIAREIAASAGAQLRLASPRRPTRFVVLLANAARTPARPRAE